MGTYYEFITQGFYGGKLSDLKYITRTNGRDEGELFSAKPDIIDTRRKKVGESKACYSGESCKLQDLQIERYKSIQYDNQDSAVYFAIYRHTLKGIKSIWKGSEKELLEELADKTRFSIVLPFSIILSLYKSKNLELVYRYDGKKFYKCSSIRSLTINRFLTEPKGVIEQLDLNYNNFIVNRFLSPKNFHTNNHRVRQFPLLTIFDLDHEQWVEQFKHQYEEENPVPF